jgi:hypothetical protein
MDSPFRTDGTGNSHATTGSLALCCWWPVRKQTGRHQAAELNQRPVYAAVNSPIPPMKLHMTKRNLSHNPNWASINETGKLKHNRNTPINPARTRNDKRVLELFMSSPPRFQEKRSA